MYEKYRAYKKYKVECSVEYVVEARNANEACAETRKLIIEDLPYLVMDITRLEE